MGSQFLPRPSTSRFAVAGVFLGLAALCVTPGLAAPSPQAPAATVPKANARANVPDTATQAEWQSTITGQIEAFRQGNAEIAFSYAATEFKQAVPDAASFSRAIQASGYGPIIHSRSHSFGSFFMLDAKTVIQKVNLIGPDQKLYQAIYQLDKEVTGWRIQGVVLAKAPGIGV